MRGALAGHLCVPVSLLTSECICLLSLCDA